MNFSDTSHFLHILVGTGHLLDNVKVSLLVGYSRFTGALIWPVVTCPPATLLLNAGRS